MLFERGQQMPICGIDRAMDRARAIAGDVRAIAQEFGVRKGPVLNEWYAGENVYFDFAIQENEEAARERIVSIRLCFGLFPVELTVRAGVSRRDGALLRHKGFFVALARAPRDLERLPDWLNLAFHCITVTRDEDLSEVIPDDGLEWLARREPLPLFDLYGREIERESPSSTNVWRTPR